MAGQANLAEGVDLLFRRQVVLTKFEPVGEPAVVPNARPNACPNACQNAKYPAKPTRAPKAPPRHPDNPFRRGMYGTIFDSLATPSALKNGMSREQLVAMVSAILGRDPRLVQYGVIIFCSPLNASPTCHRHRSAREGYGVEKVNGWVKMVLPQGKSAARTESQAEGMP